MDNLETMSTEALQQSLEFTAPLAHWYKWLRADITAELRRRADEHVDTAFAGPSAGDR